MFLTPNGDPLPRVIDTAAARELGYTAARIRTELRTTRWRQLVRGIYLTRIDLPERSDWLLAGILLAGPGAVVSGWDAVRARALGSPTAPVDDVLILARAGTNRQAGRVRVRPSARPVSWTRLPLGGSRPFSAPVAHTARAVADTALQYRNLRPVRALVTAAVQQGLCTPDQLAGELADGPRNGSAQLRRALDDVFGGAASIAEAEVADLLRSRRLPPFILNAAILDGYGHHVATADVLWPELRAVLEVDSREHHFLEPQWRSTMRRHNRLLGLGYAVAHYPPVDFRDRPDAVLAEIEAWLSGRTRELGLAL